MSVTLRDAQHLCWKTFRKIADKTGEKQSKTSIPFMLATDLLEEAGEVAAGIKLLERPRSSGNQQTEETLAARLSYLLYTVFVLAEHYGIELEESFLQTVSDYMLKFVDRFDK